MAGVIVERTSHSCGTTHGLNIYANDDGTYSGFCFSCNTPVMSPYSDKPKGWKPVIVKKTPEQIQEELEELSSLDFHALPERGLKKETLEYFGIRVGYSRTEPNKINLVAFPYGSEGESYKVRLLEPKKFWFVGKPVGSKLFGWEQASKTGARKLYICEGCFDTAALYQTMKECSDSKYAHLSPAVVSVGHGAAAAAADIAANISEIRKHFKEVVLVFDMDDAGRKATEEVCRLYPEFTVATLPAKDANECILKGLKKALFNAVMFNSAKPKNSKLILGSELIEAAMKQTEWGLSWPWESFTELTRGIRRGETYYFAAGVKMGKSTLVNEIAAHICVHHNLPIFLCKVEEDPAKSYQMLCGTVANKIFHDPAVVFDKEAFKAASEVIGDRAIIADSYQFVDWGKLKDDIRYAVSNLGVKDIIIDPLTCFSAGMSAAETNEFLTGFAADLSSMAKDLDFTAYVFAHLKAPPVGPSHEKGAPVESVQLTGSRSLMRSANMIVGLQGNKSLDLPEEQRNMRQLVILEDRNLGVTGLVNLFYDKVTGRLKEIK